MGAVKCQKTSNQVELQPGLNEYTSGSVLTEQYQRARACVSQPELGKINCLLLRLRPPCSNCALIEMSALTIPIEALLQVDGSRWLTWLDVLISCADVGQNVVHPNYRRVMLADELIGRCCTLALIYFERTSIASIHQGCDHAPLYHPSLST